MPTMFHTLSWQLELTEINKFKHHHVFQGRETDL